MREHTSPPRCRRLPLLLACTALGACVELTQAPPPAAALLSSVRVADEPADAGPFLGLTLEEALSGSLEELDFVSGLRVVGVAPGSPAEAAGICPGDVVVAAGGVDLLGLDQWQAILSSRTPGDPLRLGVERGPGVVDVSVTVGERRAGVLPAPTRFAERLKGRFVAETVLVERTEGGRTAARLGRLLPGSPLAEENFAPGDLILSLDGRPVGGARDLAERVAALPFGAAVELEVESTTSSRRVEITLWEPATRLTRLQVPILFSFSRDPAQDRTSFSLVDFWVFALYDYRRQALTVRHRLLHFFVLESGAGELREVQE